MPAEAVGSTGSLATSLELYGTEGCHLCEEALQLLRLFLKACAEEPGLLAGVPPEVVYVDIIDNAALLERYRYSIPVLCRIDTGKQINWPFGPQDILELIID